MTQSVWSLWQLPLQKEEVTLPEEKKFIILI